MSNRSKGARSELKAVKELEADGWIVYRVKGTYRWIKNCDMFDLFDIVAKKGKLTRWIQIKTNHKPKMESFKEFFDAYCSEYESVEVWVFRDYKEKQVFGFYGESAFTI